MIVDFDDLDQPPQAQPEPEHDPRLVEMWSYFTISVNNPGEVDVKCNLCTYALRWRRSYPTDLVYAHLRVIHNIRIPNL
jgi:hypothetical protein